MNTFSGRRNAAAEMAILKAQLLIARREHPRRRFSPWQRLLLAFIGAWIPAKRLMRSAVIIKPETILEFHRWLVQKKYSRVFGRAGKRGRPKLSREVRDLIVSIKLQNPSFGSPQISALILERTGIFVSEETIRMILLSLGPNAKGKGPSWLALLGSQVDSLWSIDLFRVESVLLQSYWVLVVMDQFSRKIIGFATVKGPPSGVSACVMFNRILTDKTPPKYLSHDNDPLFRFERWISNMSTLGIEEIRSVPYIPWSHPFVERLIGTLRRELFDRTLFWNEVDLQRKLAAYQVYYNTARVHQGIGGKCPENRGAGMQRKIAKPEELIWRRHCNGLFTIPEAA